MKLSLLVGTAIVVAVLGGDSCVDKTDKGQCEQVDECGWNSGSGCTCIGPGTDKFNNPSNDNRWTSQPQAEFCMGGKAVRAWYGIGAVNCSGTPNNTFPIALRPCRKMGGSSTSYEKNTCTGAPDGASPASQSFSDSACTVNTTAPSYPAPRCYCASRGEAPLTSKCELYGCQGSSRFCNSSALCMASRGNKCAFSNNQCSCTSGWFSKSACYGGVYGTLWYTSGACSGAPTHFVNKSDESRCDDTDEDGASGKIERDCQGVADLGMPVKSFFNDTSCTILRNQKQEGDVERFMCGCSNPYFQEDAQCAALVAQASAISGCIGESSPNACTLPCRPLLEQYMMLSCKYHREVVSMLSACESQLQTNKIAMVLGYTGTCPAGTPTGNPDFFVAGVADGKCRRVTEPNDGFSYVKVTCVDATSAKYHTCSSTDCSTGCTSFNMSGIMGTCASAADAGLPPPLQKIKAYAFGCAGFVTTQSPSSGGSGGGNTPTPAFSAGSRIYPQLGLALVLGLIPFLRV